MYILLTISFHLTFKNIAVLLHSAVQSNSRHDKCMYCNYCRAWYNYFTKLVYKRCLCAICYM